jgi:penicillin-binding protein 1C
MEVSDSRGPALVLRAVFAELHRGDLGRPLPLSRRLVRRRVCALSGRRPGIGCPDTEEWFRPGKPPTEICHLHREGGEAAVLSGSYLDTVASSKVRLVSPTPGLHLASDPRIPDDLEVFELRLEAAGEVRQVNWFVDERLIASDRSGALTYPWPVSRGRHTARASVWLRSDRLVETESVGFVVK